MPKYYGTKPAAATCAAVEDFENEVVVRQNNQRLVGTVYVDLGEAEWNLAVAYNLSRHPGIRGRENQLEVRYTCTPGSDGGVIVSCSDPYSELTLSAGPFDDPDAFVRFAVAHERGSTSDRNER